MLLWPAAGLLAAIVAAGCGSGRTLVARTPTGGGNGGGNGGGGGSTQVTLSRDVQPIFTANCAFAGCHLGDQAQQGQDLSEGQAYKNIVNVKSAEVDTLFRVKPSDSANSYLFQKISQDHPAVGERMPLGGSLSQTDIDTIQRWIDGGATQ
jgi:hypothetical protein